MNLLIVEDERITVRGMLEGIDWKAAGIDGEVLVAYSAAQAMKIVRETPVQIVLTDIEMPGGDGLSLMREILDIYPEIACIFLTCYAKFEYAQEAVRLGSVEYILKPAPYQLIFDVVKRTAAQISHALSQQEVLKYGEQFLEQQQRTIEALQGDKRSPEEIVEEAKLYIGSHLDSVDLSVSGVARHCYLNQDYLNRLFKKYTDTTLNRYIISERMHLAKKLLEIPSLSIAAIAAQVGYQNYSYFESTFKKQFSVTPTQWRETHKS